MTRRHVLQSFLQVIEKQAPFVGNGIRYLRRRRWQIAETLTGITSKPTMSHLYWPAGRPLVSVIIINFNYGQFLHEAIDSVLAQTFQDLEIIVIDDGSTDPYTMKILSELNKPKTHIVLQSHQGVPRTRNNGINTAQGKYICCLDSDDCLRPTYLEKCIYELETRNLDVCFSWLETFGESKVIWENGPFLIDVLMNGNTVPASALFKKTIWEEVGGYKEAMTHGYEDWEFCLSAAEQGSIGYCIPEPLLLHRKHSESRSASMKHRYNQIAEQIESLHRHLYCNPSLVKKIRQLQRRRFKVQNPLCNMQRQRDVQA